MARFSVSGTKRRALSPSSSSDMGAGGEEATRESAGAEPSLQEERASEAITVSIDPDVLDCPICFEALAAPVFQCRNGHVACSACSDKMKNGCYVCPYPLGPSRCVALEKVLESIRIPCPYANNGCQETLTYSQRGAHRKSCSYSPCFCPFPGCEFEGYLQLLSHHFRTKHTESTSFKYNVPFKVSFSALTSTQILLGEDGVLYLLHNSRIRFIGTGNSINNSHFRSIGNSITLNCIHPGILKGDVMYELTVVSGESYLSLSASVLGLKKWAGNSPSNEFLLVPSSFFDEDGELDLDVCVRKADD